MNVIRIRFREELAQEWNRVNARRKLLVALYSFAAALLLIAVLCLSGCSSTNPNAPMTHAAFTAAVTVGEQIGIETHPEVAPYLRGAASVVCSVANGTNVSPQAIVSALEAANVTNATAKIIINGSLALLNVVVAGVGTNQTEIRLYGLDLCNGLSAGLPPETPGLSGRERAIARKAQKVLPPHLK